MSAWIEHVKNYAKTNNIKYKEALKEASSSYKGSKEKANEPEITKTKSAKKAVEKVNETIESTVPPEKVKKVRIIRTIV
jgi:hypothetical protein